MRVKVLVAKSALRGRQAALARGSTGWPHHPVTAIAGVAQALFLAAPPIILDHAAASASFSCCLFSASSLSCSLDHQAKHLSPIMKAGTSPFCSSRWREVLLLITRSPHQSLM